MGEVQSRSDNFEQEQISWCCRN